MEEQKKKKRERIILNNFQTNGLSGIEIVPNIILFNFKKTRKATHIYIYWQWFLLANAEPGECAMDAFYYII